MMRVLLGLLLGAVTGSGVAGDWVGFGASPGTCNGVVNSGAVLPDGRFVVAGAFTICGDAITEGIAVYDPLNDQWSALPGGGVSGALYPQILDVEIIDSTLYAAGDFTSAGGVAAIDLAAYDLRTDRWRSMGVPGSDRILTLDAHGADLYVGGSAFGVPGIATAVNIALYLTDENRWEALGAGFSGAVHSLAAGPGVVYANGINRSTTGPGDEYRLSRFRRSTGTWTTLQAGSTHSFASHGSRLYVSGFGATRKNIVMFDWATDAMEVLSESTSPTLLQATDRGLLGFVGAVDWRPAVNEFRPSELLRFDFSERQWRPADAQLEATDAFVATYLENDHGALVGGRLSNVSVKVLKSGTWQPTPDGAVRGVSSVSAMAASGPAAWVGGSFAQGESATRRGLMRFSAATAEWKWFSHPEPDNAGVISSIAPTEHGVFITGRFARHWLARLDPASARWDFVETPFNALPSVLIAHGDFLYTAGSFGKLFRYHLPSRQWDEIAQFWSGIPFPRGTLPWVDAISINGGTLYMAGSFAPFANNSTPIGRNLAAIDLSTGQWRGLEGQGEPEMVTDLAVVDGVLYASNFQGVSRYRLAERSWESFLQADDSVLRLRAIGSALGVAGRFRTLAGQRVNGVALVDLRDGRVSALGPPRNPGVTGDAANLAQAGSRLFIAGHPNLGWGLSGAGGVASRGLIAWDLDRVRVSELYNRRFNHYFITAEAAEVQQILSDPALSQEWSTTGASFGAWRAGFPGAAGVCRFRGSSMALNTNSSHFYTRQPAECAGLTAGIPAGWTYEREAFAVSVPDADRCPAGTQAVYRSYNRRIAAESHNHRYTTSVTEHHKMVDRGHADEGIAFCVPLPIEQPTIP